MSDKYGYGNLDADTLAARTKQERDDLRRLAERVRRPNEDMDDRRARERFQADAPSTVVSLLDEVEQAIKNRDLVFDRADKLQGERLRLEAAHGLVCGSLSTIQDEIVAPLQEENVRLEADNKVIRRALEKAVKDVAFYSSQAGYNVQRHKLYYIGKASAEIAAEDRAASGGEG